MPGTPSLDALGRYEDRQAGISEELVTADGLLAVLARPLGEAGALAVAVCRSPGPEQGQLRRLQALVARSLAAAGVPALRVVGRLDGAGEALDLGLCVAEGREAVRLLEAEGAGRVVAAGAILGGAAAALLADRVAGVALWEPAASGEAYLRALLRFQRATELVHARPGVALRDPPAELERTGETRLRGLRLTRAARDELTVFRLEEALGAFAGAALLVGISLDGTPPAHLARLRDRLAGARLESLAHAGSFGQGYLQPAPVGRRKHDTRIELDREIARLTTEWAAGLS